MAKNRHNFQMDGRSISDFDNQIDATNLVNGRPIYYFKDARDEIVNATSNAGMVGCFNCTNVTLRDLNMSDSDSGILLVNTHNSIVSENQLRKLQNGIQLYFSDNDTISNNNISDDSYGLRFASSKNNTLFGNIAHGCNHGICLESSNDNAIISSNLSNNKYSIMLYASYNNTLWGNNDHESESGIELESSHNNTVSRCNLSNNTMGIHLATSTNNILFSNRVSYGESGINLESSGDNRLENNSMFRNRNNFQMDGSQYSDFDNSIDTTNLVDGRPIYYLKDVGNETIDSKSNAGLVGLFNCINITVRGLSIADAGTGVGLYKTSHTLVELNNITYSKTGIYIYSSNNNTIRFNNVSNSDYGLKIIQSDNNTIENNSVSNNTNMAIESDRPSNNKFENNSEKETLNLRTQYGSKGRIDWEYALMSGSFGDFKYENAKKAAGLLHEIANGDVVENAWLPCVSWETSNGASNWPIGPGTPIVHEDQRVIEDTTSTNTNSVVAIHHKSSDSGSGVAEKTLPKTEPNKKYKEGIIVHSNTGRHICNNTTNSCITELDIGKTYEFEARIAINKSNEKISTGMVGETPFGSQSVPIHSNIMHVELSGPDYDIDDRCDPIQIIPDELDEGLYGQWIWNVRANETGWHNLTLIASAVECPNKNCIPGCCLKMAVPRVTINVRVTVLPAKLPTFNEQILNRFDYAIKNYWPLITAICGLLAGLAQWIRSRKKAVPTSRHN
jgi:parallel beta-helix repeat protein